MHVSDAGLVWCACVFSVYVGVACVLMCIRVDLVLCAFVRYDVM